MASASTALNGDGNTAETLSETAPYQINANGNDHDPATYIHTRPRATILPVLRPFLPHALPMVRRLQLHFFSRHAVVIATFPPANPLSGSTNGISTQDTSPAGPFSIILLDRSRAPETEAWLFTTSETESHISKELARATRRQLLVLLAHTAKVPLPSSFPADADAQSMKLGAVAASTLAILQGWTGGDVAALAKRWTGGVGVVKTEHEQKTQSSQTPKSTDSANGASTSKDPDMRSAPTKQRAGGIVSMYTLPYGTFVVPPDLVNGYTDELAVDTSLPTQAEGLVWDTIRSTDHQLVIKRTNIPRTPRTLALMPSACLRIPGGEKTDRPDWSPDTAHTMEAQTPGRPVAWAFLSPDGSLATLHVEEDYRRRGLGRVLAKRALGLLGPHGSGETEAEAETSAAAPFSEPTVLTDVRKGFPLHTLRSEAWGYAHVARANAPSVAVMRGVGGVSSGECFWVVVDVGRAEEELGRMDGV